MDIDKLRQEFSELIKPKTIEDCSKLLDRYSDYFFAVITSDAEAKSSSIIDADAKLVNQMIFLKIQSIKKVIEGINFKGTNNLELRGVVDPTIVASLIRNVYETVAMFHLVNLKNTNEDEKIIIYSLWVIAGLNYRQRFASNIVTAEGQEKLKEEQKTIQEFIDKIKGTKLYQGLTEQNQRKIETKIKERDYKMSFNKTDIEFHSWQELAEIMGGRKEIFENIYTYFSLYAHPSNVAVFQFSDMFKKDTEEFKRLTVTNMGFLFMMLSIFIADYIKLFPVLQKHFDGLNIQDQLLINHYNTMARGRGYSINDSWKELG
jgi:hypothetical protein